MVKMTEQFKEAGEKAGENYVQYLLDQIAIKDNRLENLKAINESLNSYIDNNLQEGDSLPDSFVEKTRKIMEPAFYMVIRQMHSKSCETRVVQFDTEEQAFEYANDLAKGTDSEVHVLAHHETYQRTITIEQVK